MTPETGVKSEKYFLFTKKSKVNNPGSQAKYKSGQVEADCVVEKLNQNFVIARPKKQTTKQSEF